MNIARKALVVSVALGTTITGCGGQGTTAERYEKPSITAAQHFEPSNEGIVMAMEGQTDITVFSKFAYIAGFFACNGADLSVSALDDGRYTINFDFPPYFTDTEKIAFTGNIDNALNEYQGETGDSGYDIWYPEFRRMHALLDSDSFRNCQPLAGISEAQ